MKKFQFWIQVFSKYLSRYFKRSFDLKKTSPRPSLRSYLILFASFFIVLGLWQFGPRLIHSQTISEGFVGLYNRGNLPVAVAILISEPLVEINQSGKPQPKLAESWQVNNDSTIYTFKIRDNIFWHDGTSVKSSDIKFNLADVEISYPDDKTIQFKLADSFTPFPSLLTNPVFKGEGLIGVGKFKVAQEKLNHGLISKLVLVPTQDKNLPVLKVNFYQDETTAKTAFELGEVEGLLGYSNGEDLKTQPSVAFKEIRNLNKLVTIFYNTQDKTLSDKNLRKALNCAVPKIGDEEKLKSPILNFSWAYNDQLKGCDTQNAKDYLKKVEGNKDIILTATGSLSSLGNKVVEAWKELGVPAVLREESGVPQNFQAVLLVQSIPNNPDQYVLWHSTQTRTNLSKLSSPRVDKDLEDARKTGNFEERKGKYLDFQKVLADEVPATFLYFPKYYVFYRKNAAANFNKILELQLPKI